MHSEKKIRLALPVLFGALLIALFAGCFSDSMSGGGGAAAGLGGTGGVSGHVDMAGLAGTEDQPGGASGASEMDARCPPAVGEGLPQRASILSVTVEPSEREIPVSTIFDLFSSQCKGCHIEQNLGKFQVSAGNYGDTLQNAQILKRLESDDLSFAMPAPARIPYSERPAGDSVRVLVKLLKEWAAAGHPRDVFYEKLATGSGQSPYALSTELGLGFTNLGTCTPAADFPFATDRVAMAALDKAFAARVRATGENDPPEDRIGLPKDLADTDLVSFDSAVLARKGLVAFAPTYPLWSDDAGKLRYVRVPLGKSIKFDAKTQRFDIPENTRFYKTFMKKVSDASGKPAWRKLETRLIVVRHDLAGPDKTYRPQSLFGTYEWDETETHATLLTSLLRNGEPFADHLFEYEVDEPAAAKIRATKPVNLTYALESKKVLTHWAVPGSERCIHCHQGSENDNFIIGFTPLQLNSRNVGQGGVYEGGTKDQLSQFQRLIELGVITGVDSPAKVVKLEDSQLDDPQGPRTPRNEQELKAQAYILGNCAHCHNPNGYPSVAASELKDAVSGLNFYPGKRESEIALGGVFQFPLEKYSKRISHGFDNSPIPYITPSLRELEPVGEVKDHIQKFILPDDDSAVGTVFRSVPWRSLIYRNVMTPFTYSDALTLYPHMPFDTGGFDCRAPQWLGEWMVSIPAVRKHPELSENATGASQDVEPQPYTEVHPGQDGYDAAVADANKRLSVYKNDPEYSHCPDNFDLVDQDVLDGRFGVGASPHDYTGDGVPDHANWVVTDLTERKGLWLPRRTDWQDVLVDHKFAPLVNDPTGEKLAHQKAIVDQLGALHLADVSPFATAPFPLALWKNKPECKFGTSVRRVKDVPASERPAWFDKANADPQAYVFDVKPGRAIFDMICINCHGPNADSHGRQADTLQNLTGGTGRVANFRFGLFNPTPMDDPYDKPDMGLQLNRQRVFAPVVSGGVTADDWGARYLAWMALGGTGVQIPLEILNQVGRTDVAGALRSQPIENQSANMLQVAVALCSEVLALSKPFDSSKRQPNRDGGALITNNGDAELWEKLCNLGNQPHVAQVQLIKHSGVLTMTTILGSYFPAEPCQAPGVPASCYPSDWPVGDQHGLVVNGVRAENTFAWCLQRNSGDYTLPELETFAMNNSVGGKPLPICPAELIPLPSDVTVPMSVAWTNRGAINAGLAVFTYLDDFIKNGDQHIAYDQCELLPQ